MNTQIPSGTIHLTGGIDVGNGYVKAVIANTDTGGVDEIDLPSAVVSTSRQNPKVPLPDTAAVETVLEIDNAGDFYNKLDCSITSPLVSQSDRRIFGRSALSVRGSKFTEFEVMGKHSKADQELSKVLILGVFAAKAVRDFVRANGRLPDHELRVQVRAGLALPISEYVSKRISFAAEFGSAGAAEAPVHLVTVKNFLTPVSVRLEFVDVQVLAEGASAQFAITDKGEQLSAALLTDLKRTSPESAAMLEGVTAADLTAVRNTIGVDVGEGTVNFPVFTDGRFNPEAASTLEEGYGTALMVAMDRMSEDGLEFASRKQLADFLHQRPSALQRQRYSRASGYVHTEAEYLVDAIVSRFSDVLSQAGATTEAVYVYGGGSGPIKELLHAALIKAAGDIPVLYLGAAYSRHFNREGLFIAARTMQRRQEEEAAEAAAAAVNQAIPV